MILDEQGNDDETAEPLLTTAVLSGSTYRASGLVQLLILLNWVPLETLRGSQHSTVEGPGRS